MFSLRMRKVLRDLWSNKSRTFLVVLSIAIGIFALSLARSYLDAIGGRLGTTLTIEAPDGHQYQMPVAGLAHDLTAVSGRLGSNILFGYISLDTLEWLRQPRAFNQLQIAVDGDPF